MTERIMEKPQSKNTPTKMCWPNLFNEIQQMNCAHVRARRFFPPTETERKIKLSFIVAFCAGFFFIRFLLFRLFGFTLIFLINDGVVIIIYFDYMASTLNYSFPLNAVVLCIFIIFSFSHRIVCIPIARNPLHTQTQCNQSKIQMTNRLHTTLYIRALYLQYK